MRGRNRLKYGARTMARGILTSTHLTSLAARLYSAVLSLTVMVANAKPPSFMRDIKHSAFFRSNFEIEAPDFWCALNRMELQVESPSDFTLEMSVLYDDEALPHSIISWRTQVIWTQVVGLSPELHQTIMKVKAS